MLLNNKTLSCFWSKASMQVLPQHASFEAVVLGIPAWAGRPSALHPVDMLLLCWRPQSLRNPSNAWLSVELLNLQKRRCCGDWGSPNWCSDAAWQCHQRLWCFRASTASILWAPWTARPVSHWHLGGLTSRFPPPSCCAWDGCEPRKRGKHFVFFLNLSSRSWLKWCWLS